MAFQMFWSAMAPLREAGRLGMLAFQFPPYFIPKPAKFDYLASLPGRLPGASIAIEFRHPSWIRDKTRRIETMNFLGSQGLYYGAFSRSAAVDQGSFTLLLVSPYEGIRQIRDRVAWAEQRLSSEPNPKAQSFI